MIVVQNATDWNGNRRTLEIPSYEERLIDASGLTLLPGLIDPHVHFRTPGLEHKEDWRTGAKAAISGGITTVFDMPNTIPPCITLDRLKEKKQLIKNQLQECSIPLHFGLYLGADKFHLDEIAQCKDQIVGVKVFMGSSTGDLVMDDDESLHSLFEICAMEDVLLAVHAEDEALLRQRKALFSGPQHPRTHSKLRSPEIALRATEKALELSRRYKTRLYLLHIGTKEEVSAIRKAKQEHITVFAETAPHYLFLNESYYETLGTKAQVNPPLRQAEDNEALWGALNDGTIDTIGSDHAPHTLTEKEQPYGTAPSGIPGVETTLPLFLNAFWQKKISLAQIVRLMRDNINTIFRRKENQDWVLVDLRKIKTVHNQSLHTKCHWSPYSGETLTGWPIYTILGSTLYVID